MNDEYLSIRQFSEAVGKTQQAIYQQLETRLKSYVKVIDNKKLIRRTAINEVFGAKLDKTIDNDDSSDLIKDLTSELTSIKATLQVKNDMIEQLQNEISRADQDKQYLHEQLTVKDNQISELTAALKASQSIQAMYLKQIEDKEQDRTEQEPEQKKGFFDFFRRKNK